MNSSRASQNTILSSKCDEEEEVAVSVEVTQVSKKGRSKFAKTKRML